MTIRVNLGRQPAKRPLNTSAIGACFEAEHGEGAGASGVRGLPRREGFSMPRSIVQSLVW
jgi:hypothetical protein